MTKARAHVGAAVHHTRTAARQALGGKAPHTRRAPLTHQPGALVMDTVSGQEGVILSGKKTHVPTQSAQ